MALFPTTLQTLITAARLRCDMRTNQYLNDTEFTSHINASLSTLDGDLISKFDDYKITPVFTNVVPNTNNLAIPLDFLKFRGLDLLYDNNSPDGYITVRQHSFQKRNDKSYPGTSVAVGPTSITYRLQGQNIALLPASIAAQYTYRLWYTPDYILLVNPTDTLQPYMDSQMWFDYAICDVAVKVHTMQGMTDEAQILMAQAAELRDHIMKVSAPNRDAGEPKAVVDTRHQWEGNYGGGGYGSNW